MRRPYSERRPVVLQQWTPEEDAALTQFWRDGLSASQTALALNRAGYGLRTRCSVLGRAHRIGLPKREPHRSASDSGREGRLRRIRRGKRTSRTMPITLKTETKPLRCDALPDAPLNIRLLDRKPGQCGTISGHDKCGDALICGRPTVFTEESFCPSCAARFYNHVATPHHRKLRQSDNRISAALRAMRPEYRAR